MQMKFSDMGELGGIPIMKDNCEDLFSSWTESMDVSDVFEYAEEYGKAIYKSLEK